MIPFAFYDVSDEGAYLAAQIGDQARALTTDDCASACKALDSMRRSVRRLCELESGARCADAKKTLADSEKKVMAACPVCAAAPPPPPMAPPPEKPAPPAKPDEAKIASTAPEAQRAPPGCGGCATTSSPGDVSTFLVATAWMLARLRRRRRQGTVSKQ